MKTFVDFQEDARNEDPEGQLLVISVLVPSTFDRTAIPAYMGALTRSISKKLEEVAA